MQLLDLEGSPCRGLEARFLYRVDGEQWEFGVLTTGFDLWVNALKQPVGPQQRAQRQVQAFGRAGDERDPVGRPTTQIAEALPCLRRRVRLRASRRG